MGHCWGKKVRLSMEQFHEFGSWSRPPCLESPASSYHGIGFCSERERERTWECFHSCAKVSWSVNGVCLPFWVLCVWKPPDWFDLLWSTKFWCQRQPPPHVIYVVIKNQFSWGEKMLPSDSAQSVSVIYLLSAHVPKRISERNNQQKRFRVSRFLRRKDALLTVWLSLMCR